MTELTDAEAQKIFAEVSGAIKENDLTKLGAALAEPAVETQETPAVEAETPAVETPAVVPETPAEEEVIETPQVETPAEEQPVVTEVPAKTEEQTELEKLRAQLEKVNKDNHALRSQAGRVPHVQRRLKELDQKLADLANKTKDTPSNRPSDAIQAKVEEALKGIKETDGELADTIAAAIKAAIAPLADNATSREQETVKLLRDQTFADYQESEATRLLEMYPNAPEVFSSPTWKEWKNEQSRGIQQLAGSDNADEVAFAFKKYADDMIAKYPELATPAVVTPPVEAAVVVDPKAAQIEAERKRKQAASVTVATPNAAGKTAEPTDPQALFEKYSSEIRKSING